MTDFVVSGYASLDHAMAIGSPPHPGRTTIVRDRLSEPWPGYGGCGPYVARALAGAGRGVSLLSWVGDDAAGRDFIAALGRAGVDTTRVQRLPGARTACSWLLYDADGGTTCVYDPGGKAPAGLTPEQQAAVTAAAWTVLTVGPQPVNREILRLLPPASRLAFAVKADADAFPADLVRDCLDRAAVVAFSTEERAFLEDTAGADAVAGPGRRRVTVETHGRDGVAVTAGGTRRWLTVDAVPVVDATGAGDTLLGATLARLAGIAGWPPRIEVAAGAVADGMAAARALLMEKSARRGT